MPEMTSKISMPRVTNAYITCAETPTALNNVKNNTFVLLTKKSELLRHFRDSMRNTVCTSERGELRYAAGEQEVNDGLFDIVLSRGKINIDPKCTPIPSTSLLVKNSVHEFMYEFLERDAQADGIPVVFAHESYRAYLKTLEESNATHGLELPDVIFYSDKDLKTIPADPEDVEDYSHQATREIRVIISLIKQRMGELVPERIVESVQKREPLERWREDKEHRRTHKNFFIKAAELFLKIVVGYPHKDKRY